MPFRGLLVKHQNGYLYLQTSSVFPTLQEGNVEYCILFENCIVDWKNVFKESRHLRNIHFSNIFDVGRILAGLKFSFISFLPFLCTGVTSANFKEEGKLKDLIVLFMLVNKKSTNISVFSLIILMGILAFCKALVLVLP